MGTECQRLNQHCQPMPPWSRMGCRRPFLRFLGVIPQTETVLPESKKPGLIENQYRVVTEKRYAKGVSVQPVAVVVGDNQCVAFVIAQVTDECFVDH